jgi:hypothetical protein
MSCFKTTIVLLLAVVALCWVSGGSAQQPTGTAQDSVGDLGLAVRQDDLDAYWLDTREWYSFGYRPYAKVHLSRFAPGLPSWSSPAAATTGGYSFGINEQWGDTSAPWQGGQPEKFQLTKYGTWH